jgi:ABC-type hemin transport system ATPase subunit
MAAGRFVADGPAAEVLRADALTEIYGCPVRTAEAAGRTFIYPEVEEHRRK